jgi:hypothetical protein
MITFEEFKEHFKKKLVLFYFLNKEYHKDKLDLFLIQAHDEYILFIIRNSDLKDFDTRFSYKEKEITQLFEDLTK